MLDEFARCYQVKAGDTFDTRKRHIWCAARVNLSAIDLRLTVSSSCLAHIVNLTTQALISTCSKAKYYSPDDEDAHIPDLTSLDQDEAGLVRAICVKARTSAQRKALFKSIQVENNIKPLQLLLIVMCRLGLEATGRAQLGLAQAKPGQAMCLA